MKERKFVAAVVLALIVIGCIVTAGCTSLEPAEEKTILTGGVESVPSVSGTWASTDDSDNQDTHVFYKDGTGCNYEIYDGKYMSSLPLTWRQTTNVVDVMYGDGSEERFVYQDDETLKSSDGSIFTRTADALHDAVVKTWILQEDSPAMHLRIFKWDGTGMDVDQTENESITVNPFSWSNNGETYTLTYPDKKHATMTLNATGTTLTCSYDKGKKVSAEYKDYQHSSWDSVIGVWDGYHQTDDETYQYRVTVLLANDTGTEFDINPNGSMFISTFTWKKDGTRYLLTYENGKSDKISYESADETVNYSDGTVLKRRV